jgi:hypothetical protein
MGGPLDGGSHGNGGAAEPTEALLETLLRTLHRHPDRLDEVDRLLKDLEATETEAEPLVPPGLREVFLPILAARGARA